MGRSLGTPHAAAFRCKLCSCSFRSGVWWQLLLSICCRRLAPPYRFQFCICACIRCCNAASLRCRSGELADWLCSAAQQTVIFSVQPASAGPDSTQQDHYLCTDAHPAHPLPSSLLPLCELVPFSSASSSARRSSLPDVDGDAGSGCVMAILSARSDWELGTGQWFVTTCSGLSLLP